ISLGLAAVVIIATLGIAPTPAAIRRALGGGGEAFPCENHACGCTSAEDCFGSCCCFSPAELAAWRRGQTQPTATDSPPPTPQGDDHCELCQAPPAAPHATPPEPEPPA